MINLLPLSTKQEIYYARKNLFIIRWVLANIIAIILLSALLFIGGIYIDNSQKDLRDSNTTIQADMKTAKLDTVKQDAENISSGVKLISQILSQELRFSILLQKIGSLMPENTILSTISLTSNISNPVDITAYAIDYRSATQVQINFQDKSKALFESVDANNITCADIEEQYKCTISIKAKFSSDAAITYLNTITNGGGN